MKTARVLAIVGVLALGLYVAAVYGLRGALSEYVLQGIEDDERMKNVTVKEALPAAAAAETLIPEFSVSAELAAEPEGGAGEAENADGAAEESAAPVMEPLYTPESPMASLYSGEDVEETTIRGGLSIKNETSYWVDAAQIVSDGPGLTLTADAPQILIIHTHSSEAYTQAGLDRYQASDTYRTEDTEFNIVRIGDELTELFEQAGLNVIHDRGIYDYPSYTGSYTRSGEAIAQYLSDYPSISIVIDIHRDSIGSDGVVYKTMAEEEGTVASQIMLLVGTDESGLEHPNWRKNLAVALYMQDAANSVNPTLMRPVSLVRERYNQHLSQGSLIMEVGSNGNTLQEALAAIRLFGKAVGPALMQLVEDAEQAQE